ncbi:MAG: trypsin-like peptidase domain-containing protein [Peptococcaceae bacterium]|jgi:S1-C subfamily serine protease|nr:trypsin-like peptidase domain-containing protein [Peptococcaceae bacterium]
MKMNETRVKVFVALLIFVTGWLAGHSAYLMYPAANSAAYSAEKEVWAPEGSRAGIGQEPNVLLSSAVSGTVMASDTIQKIVDKTGDSVVKIETTQASRYGQSVSGLGSGAIISKDGYILTNYHVVEGARQINVYLTTGKDPVSAVQVGASRELDLAILKIAVSWELPYLNLGDSDEVHVGDWVIAIGNPFGLDHTVTVGVISAKSRPVTLDNQVFEDLLQTDASINPGNSGGPLLNLRGEIIGINTAINQEAQGIGFAIPSSTIQQNLQILMSGGKKVPWLGVSMREMTQRLANYLGMLKVEGVFVNAVYANSPAEKAGIRGGDVILEVNGTVCSKSADVQAVIQAQKPGDPIVIKLLRDGRTTVTVTAVLEEIQG